VKLLLDTHVWLWALLEPARLRREVSAQLASADNEKWISPISVWETLLLGERGRLKLEPDPESWVRAQLRRAPIRQIALDHEVAIQSRQLRASHDDPADRFIAATARVHELILVTADARLLRRPDGYAVLRAA
jgi:PIN domain nuclease of toxin-antitoxin system